MSATATKPGRRKTCQLGNESSDAISPWAARKQSPAKLAKAATQNIAEAASTRLSNNKTARHPKAAPQRSTPYVMPTGNGLLVRANDTATPATVNGAASRAS